MQILTKKSFKERYVVENKSSCVIQLGKDKTNLNRRKKSLFKKSRIRETPTLSTDADRSTDNINDIQSPGESGFEGHPIKT